MLKMLARNVLIYDCEWAADPIVGQQVYRLPPGMTEREIVEEMYRRGGATPENPRPYLKTTLCKIVSVAAVVRRREDDGSIRFALRSLPTVGGPALDEREIVNTFLAGIGRQHPQLVGFNCREADMPILLQRAVALSLWQPQFSKRPDKPWEGSDYFVKNGDWHVDLKDVVGGFGKSTPSLHELCVASGIPGKLDTHGSDVSELVMAGDINTIAAYNQCDVLSTYELFMRVVLLAGFISEGEHEQELKQFHEFLGTLAAEKSGAHIQAYLSEAQRLRHAMPHLQRPRGAAGGSATETSQPQLELARA